MPDKPVNSAPRLLAFHKPKGLLVTRRDERGRRTVYDALPGWVRELGWVPVGRLDADSRGLLLFTREGALVEALTRPGACEKAYEVWVRGVAGPDQVARALRGVDTALGLLKLKACRVTGGAGAKTRLEVALDEGKNRHIRRVFGALKDARTGTSLKVLELKRVRIGPLKLDLPSGAWRFLTREEEQVLPL
jgi:23S rRNA pseudouridine2605 synthase